MITEEERQWLLRSEKGSALFLIFIAVVLFSALAFAVSGMTRSSSEGIDKERADIAAGQWFDYLSALQSGFHRLTLMEGTVSLSNFGTPDGWGSYTPCTTGDTCMFSTTGGGVHPKSLPGTIYVLPFSTTAPSFSYSIQGVGTAAGEDFGILFWSLAPNNAISHDICEAFNRRVGLSGTVAAVFDYFGGTITGGYPGEPTACVQFGGGIYSIYHVIDPG